MPRAENNVRFRFSEEFAALFEESARSPASLAIFSTSLVVAFAGNLPQLRGNRARAPAPQFATLHSPAMRLGDIAAFFAATRLLCASLAAIFGCGEERLVPLGHDLEVVHGPRALKIAASA